MGSTRETRPNLHVFLSILGDKLRRKTHRAPSQIFTWTGIVVRTIAPNELELGREPKKWPM